VTAPRVLVACERSGVVRRAFAAAGCEAWSCDLAPAEDGDVARHHQGDVLELLAHGGRWDLLVAHPPCTYLASSGLHWEKRRPERAALREQAAGFARALWKAPVFRCALENPIGALSRPEYLGKATQIVHPHQYGHDASKATNLWLRNLPLLRPTRPVAPWWVCGCGRAWRELELAGIAEQPRCPACGRRGKRSKVPAPKPRWGNQTNSGQNKLGPSETRQIERSRTYDGIAAAMAATWAPLLHDRSSARGVPEPAAGSESSGGAMVADGEKGA
jgi:hypothetical protein